MTNSLSSPLADHSILTQIHNNHTLPMSGTEFNTSAPPPSNAPKEDPTSPELVSEESYKLLKRKMKEISEANAALNRDYIHAKKKIRTLTFERNLLLDNIGRLENMSHLSDDSDSDLHSDLTDTDDDLDVSASINSVSTKFKVSKRLTHKPTVPHQRNHSNNNNSCITTTNSTFNNNYTIDPTHDVTIPTTTAPKRSKLTKLSVKTRRVQPIDRDEDGNPKLPQQIGVLTVINLGKIITDRPAFHNERYIFPIGYAVSRVYPSMIDPNSNTVITSTILDGGDSPRFHVVAEDMPGEPIIANSATGAWTVVVRKSNEIRHREHSNSASGPDYYGFKHPTIANLIQDLPGAKYLKQYVWQTFEEMEPRAAKGVMAAAEKKRGNLEQMGNANRKVPADQHHEGVEEDEEADELIASDNENV